MIVGQLLRFRDMLLDKRADVMERARKLGTALEALQGREIEIEEEAQKADITDQYNRLDEVVKNQVDLIDLALRKIPLGEYGICETCGDDIGEKRLEALPWARLCVDCAREYELKGASLAAAVEVLPPAGLPDEYRGLSNEAVIERIYEEIHKDSRIDAEEIKIALRGGVVYLNGHISGEQERQILLQLLSDDMGFNEVVDNLESIESTGWEKEGATLHDTNLVS